MAQKKKKKKLGLNTKLIERSMKMLAQPSKKDALKKAKDEAKKNLRKMKDD